ncbi:MAG: hypothetical protein Ct9H300mP16_16720 [Pseudomonadota bacterium]|nr:MAG: hypothetical protein Ct9H300mP16_16720 [Pseudomonadota bacterium]
MAGIVCPASARAALGVAGFLQTFGINNWNYLLLSQINL